MKKLRLDFDELQVETFDPTADAARPRAGTVRGHWRTEYTCLETQCGEVTCESCGGTCEYTCYTCPATCANTCPASCNGSCAATCGEATCFSCGGSCEWTCNDTCWGTSPPFGCC